MKNLILVTKAVYLHDYVIEIAFSDGIKAEIDFSGWIDKLPYFAPLKDLSYFKNFSLDGWTVVWENGADIAPETLHEIAIKKHELQTA